MSRVQLLDETIAAASVQAFYANGYPGPIPASLANIPEVMQVALPFIGRVLGPSTLDARVKEIVILRTSAQQRCRYCTQTHTAVALDCGLSVDEVKALRGEGSLERTFRSAAETALIGWADAVGASGKPVDDSAVKAIKAHYSEADVVELTLLVGATLMLNRYATALELPTSELHLARLSTAGLA